MFLLYFLLETPVGLPDFCPYMYVRRGSSLEEGHNSKSNIKTAICRLNRRFGKTSLLEWRLDIINTGNSKFWDCTKQSDDLYKFIVDTTRKFCPF